MELRPKGQRLGDFLDAQVGRVEHLFGLLDPQLEIVLIRRQPGVLAEDAVEVAGFQAQGSRQFFHGRNRAESASPAAISPGKPTRG